MAAGVSKKNIPGTIDELIRQLGETPAFRSWDGKTHFSIAEIKAYCVPGNRSSVKGQMAIWVQSAKAKKPRILFAQLVLWAMHFIADPKGRGSNHCLHWSNFRNYVRQRDPNWDCSGLADHALVYLALARRLLGLPDNYQDEADGQERARQQARLREQRPNTQTRQGLLQDTLMAYVSAMAQHRSSNPGSDSQASPDWVNMALNALWRRHGSMAVKRDDLQEYLEELYLELQNNPDHEDIRSISVCVFAMLYTNGMSELRSVRGGNISSVVNALADAADEHALGDIEAEIARQCQAHQDQAAEFSTLYEAAFKAMTR